jgi:hypothetical protein
LDYAARAVVGLWGLNGVARRVAIAWWGFCRLAGTERWCESDLRVGWQGEVAPPSREQQVTSGTFETNGNGCLIAFEQAIQRGMEAAQLLCCHDVSKMIGTRSLMIG